MTSLSLRNPIAVLMLCIGVVVFAAVVTPRMSVDTFPELTPPVLVIGTLAPGLGPKDVEKTITWRLEKYVSATPGVDHVESVSRNSLSIIYVWLKWGTDLNGAQTLVQQQAAFAMAAVPKSLGVLPPFVLQYDPSNAPVIQVVVSGVGYTGPQLYDYAFNNIEPLLEGIPGVASAAPDGGRMRQINVVVDPARAQARGVTAADVADAVAKSNALLPSGEFIAPKFDANVYTNAIPTDVETLGEAPVKGSPGRMGYRTGIHRGALAAVRVKASAPGPAVFIRDVATVVDGGTPPTQSVAVNGHDAVYLNVLRIPGGNTIQIVDAVKKVVGALHDLPPGMEVKAYFDQSTFVRTTYHGLKKEIVQALVLIGVVILIFLQSVRGTLIVSIAIPLSFAITLLVLYAAGQTLNAFTLGGLTLAMGRLVDDAVVVLESIHRHQRMGLATREAALRGTTAVALPVLASTLTTMAVLLPVLLLAGLAKKLFAPLALTVAVAMIASYFVSMAVTPVACRYFLGHVEHRGLGKRVEAIIDRVADAYARTLRRVLPFRWLVVTASIVLVVASGWSAGHLPSTFFPEIDEGMDMIYVRFAPGIALDQAAVQLDAMGRTLSRELPSKSVEMVIANLGTPQNARSAIVSPNVGPHTGFLRLAFSDPEERSLSQAEMAARARQILTREFPGVETLQYPGGLVASVFANGYTAPIVIEVRGEKLEELDAYAKAVAEVARTVPGVRDVRSSLQIDYPEIRVETDRQKAGLVGVSLRSAAQTTLEATLGNINTPSVWIDSKNGQSYYVVTSYDGRRVGDTQALSQLPVRVSPTGQSVPLGAYGQIRRSLGPIAVERNQLQRAAHVLMQTEGRDIGSVASDLERALRADPSTRHIAFDFVGQVQLMRTTFSGLGLALGLAVMVVFMIMASQFKSLRLPFVMLFTIPVSLVGIVLALMAAGQGFSITALMGILMVIGIAVSNGILLVDDANRRLNEGAEVKDAIIAAARSRFVPIAMTSLATVIGLIPTALGLERGSEANQPLALAVVGGLSSSTILSLFLVPVMFLFFARRAAPEGDEPEGAVLVEAHS
ncbi:MAG TPA: efflux RND transporter permease subunit [Polyangia bacterium]|nr:efflux RND transporter permease subunit [Polyangia bacterium]